MSDHDHCKCGRVLQPGWATEMGICDRCRETPVLEKTELANRDTRSKLIDKVRDVFTKYPEFCTCDYCYGKWERHG